jgi:monoterpene epsilon-lactone hydrolase
VTLVIEKLREALRANAPDPDATVEEIRAHVDAISAKMPVPSEVDVQATTVGGIPGERLTPPGDTDCRTVLCMHGGGGCMGSMLSVRGLGANVALAARAVVIDLDYRLAPEHPCPAAIEDVLTASDALLADGVAPERLAIAGDSAGGGLTVDSLVAIRDSGRPLPAAGVGISPAVDVAAPGASVDTNAELDPLVSRKLIDRMADWYSGGLPLDDPACPRCTPTWPACRRCWYTSAKRNSCATTCIASPTSPARPGCTSTSRPGRT